MEMILSTTAGMDSREIAEQAEKRHDNVCRDILAMLADLRIDPLRFEGVYRGGNGEPRRCYILPKRECLILASGYSVTLRSKIIDRWAELEAAAVPRSFAAALRLAAEQAEAIEEQQRQIAAAAPAVAFVDRYVEANGTQTIRGVAKLVKMKEKTFITFLEDSGILYRLSGKLTPAAEHMTAGRFEVKAGESRGHAFAQTRFTPAGIEWITGRLAKAKT